MQKSSLSRKRKGIDNFKQLQILSRLDELSQLCEGNN